MSSSEGRTRASAFVGLNETVKRTREEMSALRAGVLSHMKEIGMKEMEVGDVTLRIQEKKSRKSIGEKRMLALVKEKLGEDAVQKLKSGMEELRGVPKVSESLKIVKS